ncbi:MAG: hypothetical protein IPG42_00350 [Betaproteobacteria bacterium]|nr:hypothetical protein [Betaproteobacteria bacterium]
MARETVIYQFCNNLIGAGVTLVPYLMAGFQWHAKVFLLKHFGNPIFGIVGSSNFTANAFGVSNVPALATDSPFPTAKFNFECDVYFWNAANALISAAMNNLINQDLIREQVFLTQYDDRENLNRSIEVRLLEIEQQIWASGGIQTLF